MDELKPLVLPPGMRNTGTTYQSANRWLAGNFVRFFDGTIQPIGGWSARELTTVTQTTEGLLAALAATPVTGVSEAFDVSDWTAATNVTAYLNSGKFVTSSSVNAGAVSYTAIGARETWMVQSVSATSPGEAIVGPMARVESAAAPNDYVYAHATTLTASESVGVREFVAGVQTADDTDADVQDADTFYRMSLVTTASSATSHHFDDATTRTITLTAGVTSGNAGVYHGSADLAVACEHSEWYAMKGRYLTVNGPSGRNWTAQVLDASDTVLASAAAVSGQALVDMIAVAFPAAVRLKVIDTDNANAILMDEEPAGRLWGGDVWTWAVTTMSGVPRAMHTYRLNSGRQVLIVGTTTGLYAISANTVYDITPTDITGANTIVWQLDVMGTWLVATSPGNGNQVPPVADRAWYWDGDLTTIAVPLEPFSSETVSALKVYSTVVTPERYLVMLGGSYTETGNDVLGVNGYDRIVTWATQEGGFGGVGEWTPSASNTAGDFNLPTDGALRCGRKGRGNTLLWTTTDLWTMTYIGGSFIYRFDQAAYGCGIISSHAAVVTSAGAFWMGENGFFHYEAFVADVPCDVQDYVFGSLNRTYAHYIWAVDNPAFSEVTWYYPHAAQTEITRYVTYNYKEKHWVTGTLVRTAGVANQQGTHAFPVLANASAVIFNHETGTGRNSEGTPSLESGPMQVGNGDRLLEIQKVLPDDDTVGDVNLTFYTAPNPDTAETTVGPYTLTAKTDVRVKGRQIRVKLTQAVAAAWRVGTMRFGIKVSSRR